MTLPKVLKTVRTVSSLTADESPETLSVCPGMNSYSQLKLYEIVPRLAQVASTSATTKRLFSLIDTSFRHVRILMQNYLRNRHYEILHFTIK